MKPFTSYRLFFTVKAGKKSEDPLIIECKLWQKDQDGEGIVDSTSITYNWTGDNELPLDETLQLLLEGWVEFWELREQAISNLPYEIGKEYEIQA